MPVWIETSILECLPANDIELNMFAVVGKIDSHGFAQSKHVLFGVERRRMEFHIQQNTLVSVLRNLDRTFQDS